VLWVGKTRDKRSDARLGNVLEPGDRAPDAQVWTAPGAEPVQLREALGEGLTLIVEDAERPHG
jgi:hypothetical protein